MAANQHSERPIQIAADDLLDRLPFVERLRETLLNEPKTQARGIVVGITGAWGSGKSSILNMLERSLSELSSDPLVVRFDPWLISNRDHLIGSFFAELQRHLIARKKKKIREQAAAYMLPFVWRWMMLLRDRRRGRHSLVYQVGTYANIISPSLAALPGGAVATKVLDVVSSTAAKKVAASQTLAATRSELARALASFPHPIIVMIDELDRIEDGEIREICQLVKSVMDFDTISYVLAYDAQRVAEALGRIPGEPTNREYGQSYLEKIVQHAFPIPVTFTEELERLFLSQLLPLSSQIGLSEDFSGDARFKDISKAIVGELLQTP